MAVYEQRVKEVIKSCRLMSDIQLVAKPYQLKINAAEVKLQNKKMINKNIKKHFSNVVFITKHGPAFLLIVYLKAKLHIANNYSK